MTSLAVMLEFTDLDTSIRVQTTISPIIILSTFQAVNMTILIHMPIGTYKNKMIGIMPILYKAQCMATMLNMTI